jgi:hypothetical protein
VWSGRKEQQAIVVEERCILPDDLTRPAGEIANEHRLHRVVGGFLVVFSRTSKEEAPP